MKNISYFEKLKDPRWQRKRLEALSASEFGCECCGNGEITLNVHHKEYFKGRDPWQYEVGQLSVLCEACHEMQHESLSKLKIISSFLPLDGLCNRDEMAGLMLEYITENFPKLALTIRHSLEKNGMYYAQ